MNQDVKYNNLSEMHQLLDAVSNRTPSQESMLAMLTFLKASGYSGHVDLKDQTILCGMTDKEARVSLWMQFSAASGLCTLYMRWVDECVPAGRKLLANLVHRINEDLQNGRFAFDTASGQCGFYVSHFFGSTPMDDGQCMYLAALAAHQTTWYRPTVLPILHGQRPDPMNTCVEYVNLTREEPDLLRGLARDVRSLN